MWGERMDRLGKPEHAASEAEQPLSTKADYILQEAEEIVRARQRAQSPHAGLLNLAEITWTCEVCGCVNKLANISSCQNCGC